MNYQAQIDAATRSWTRAKNLAKLTGQTINQARSYLSQNPDLAKLVDLKPEKVAQIYRTGPHKTPYTINSDKLRGIKGKTSTPGDTGPISPLETTIEGIPLSQIKQIKQIGIKKTEKILQILKEL
jgi:hypothetical protein